MSSGLIKFLKSLVKELGEAALGAIVSKHADNNRLSVQQRRDLVDELEEAGISVEHAVKDDQAKRAESEVDAVAADRGVTVPPPGGPDDDSAKDNTEAK